MGLRECTSNVCGVNIAARAPRPYRGSSPVPASPPSARAASQRLARRRRPHRSRSPPAATVGSSIDRRPRRARRTTADCARPRDTATPLRVMVPKVGASRVFLPARRISGAVAAGSPTRAICPSAQLCRASCPRRPTSAMTRRSASSARASITGAIGDNVRERLHATFQSGMAVKQRKQLGIIGRGQRHGVSAYFARTGCSGILRQRISFGHTHCLSRAQWSALPESGQGVARGG